MEQEARMVLKIISTAAIIGMFFGLTRCLLAFRNDNAKHYTLVHWLFILSSITLVITGSGIVFRLFGIPGVIEGIYTVGSGVIDKIKKKKA